MTAAASRDSALKNRHHCHTELNQYSQFLQSKAIHMKRKNGDGYLRQLVVTAILAIVSVSLAISLWCLPTIAQDQRSAMVVPSEINNLRRKKATLKQPLYNSQRRPSGIKRDDEVESRAEKSADAHSAKSQAYASQAELEARSSRFPSVDERVRVYMTNWYLPPCESDDAVVKYNIQNNTMVFREARTAKEKLRKKLRTFLIDDTTDFNFLHYMNRAAMEECDSVYCTDMVKYLYPALNRTETDIPILYQFSDIEKTRAFIVKNATYGPYPNVPHMKKFRFAISKDERERVVSGSCATRPRPVPTTIVQEQERKKNASALIIPTSLPVLLKLKTERHFGFVEEVPLLDRAWELKRKQAIFRGQFTGPIPTDKPDFEQLPADVQCQFLQRCRLVYNSASSDIIDAKLVLPVLDVRKNFPRMINGIQLYEEPISIKDMLAYKAIIMLEGNDVSSGLKWALYSNSVVMMQEPTKTSWAMEELLEPWVHYIPLSPDLSDVEAKMQWVIDNDDEAQRISHRGKLWISDLAYHPDADGDERRIYDEILRRYTAHFLRDETLTLEKEINLSELARPNFVNHDAALPRTLLVGRRRNKREQQKE